MFVKTKNVYGQIAISNKSIAKFVAHVAADCYGVVEFVPQNVFQWNFYVVVLLLKVLELKL